MKILLHQCCAPCSGKVIEILSSRFSITGFWYNPNIHPESEYNSRKESLLNLNNFRNIETVCSPEITQAEWLANAPKTSPDRCRYCYISRLNKTAEEAKQRGIEQFSTTLLISPFQKHELVKEAGETAAINHGVDFVYEDMRRYYYESKQSAREAGLYMQKYCGCSYSKAEREERPSVMAPRCATATESLGGKKNRKNAKIQV